MGFVSRAKEIFSDFLFPKTKQVLELEALSPSTLLEILPPAQIGPNEEFSALFAYNSPLTKEAVWEIKYGGNRNIAAKIGEILHNLILTEIEEEASTSALWLKAEPLLLPIPISEKRRFERGWNQTEILCEAIKKADATHRLKYIPRQLIKTHHTESQTKTASKRERLENLKGSMRVQNPESISRKCVVLIDDVATTGATFNEARRAVRAAGAGKILCIAVAH